MQGKALKTFTPVVYITGASRGIGFAIASHLARVGYRVYAMTRNSSNSSDLDKAVKQLSPQLTKLIGDVTQAPSIEENIQQIISESGRLDVVINNALHVLVGTCETCTIEEQQQSMDVNYFGTVRVLQSALPFMRKQRSGHIINVSSVAGYEPFPHLESYVASKFALEGLTESLASHLSPWNIRVSLIEPGGVKTEGPRAAPLGSRLLKDTDAYKKYCSHAKQQMVDGYHTSMETQMIALLVEEILKSKSPHLRYPVGDFATMRAKERFQDPTGDSYVKFKTNLLKEKAPLTHLQNNP